MTIRKAVVGVVYRKGDQIEFLILHRILLWKGWEFPKGGIERSDRAEEAALIREIQEETGLSGIRVREKLPYQIKYDFPKYNEKYTGTVQSVYLVRAFDGEITLTKEHDAFKWLPYKEAKKLLTHQQQKKALDIAMEFLENERS